MRTKQRKNKSEKMGKYERIRENLVDVIGIGWFIVGVCSILQEGFTFFSLAWFVLGCLWIFSILFIVFKERRGYTACILLFTLIFLFNYLIGSILEIYKFRPEGLLYWYLVAVIVGSLIYFLQKRR
jgi:hypothetical protein